MNVIKSLLAVAVVACSANVSAQIVYIPDFPVKKAVDTLNAEQKAPAADAVAHSETASKTAA
ncbi:hypothetical protein [Acinetobacter sp. BSP-28]|uniref:hypothetical protein n=1 Tax=Acinetobacter sp. BSP-28 TaxID=3344661 RepID=UPI0037707227